MYVVPTTEKWHNYPELFVNALLRILVVIQHNI